MTSSAHLVDIPENPVPSGGDAFWLQGFDGKPLRAALWPATVAAPRGTVLLFGGRTEFIEKYCETIGLLRARGFAVAMLDWRGQGLSVRETDNPLRGHIDSFADFDRDLAEFLKAVAARGLPAPFVGLAHSMGGHIVLRWLYWADSAAPLAAGVPRMVAAVLAAPMVALAMGEPAMLAMRGLCFSAIALGFGKRYLPGGSDKQALDNDTFEGNLVTSDKRRFARQAALVTAEPALNLAAPTFGWGGAAAESMDWLHTDTVIRGITTPVLLCGASEDKVVSTPAVAAYARHLPNARYMACEGARHEIMMERDALQEPFWHAFDAFIDEVASDATSS